MPEDATGSSENSHNKNVPLIASTFLIKLLGGKSIYKLQPYQKFQIPFNRILANFPHSHLLHWKDQPLLHQNTY